MCQFAANQKGSFGHQLRERYPESTTYPSQNDLNSCIPPATRSQAAAAPAIKVIKTRDQRRTDSVVNQPLCGGLRFFFYNGPPIGLMFKTLGFMTTLQYLCTLRRMQQWRGAWVFLEENLIS